MIQPIPAPGFREISGERNPPSSSDGYWVQLRNGWVDEHGPWPARGPRWKWKGPSPEDWDDWDVVAVKKAA